MPENDYSIEALLYSQNQLMFKVPHEVSEVNVLRLTAAKGLIEEVLEYLNSVGTKPWRPNPLPEEQQLEEITDPLFFYLELILLSGFKWKQIVGQYNKKWKINMARYESGAKGDYSWDDRATKKEL